jgi:hypothetical protein
VAQNWQKLSLPLRFLFAREPRVMSEVLSNVYRTIARQIIQQAV